VKLHYANMVRGNVRYRTGNAIALLMAIVCVAINILSLRAWNDEHQITNHYPDTTLQPTRPGTVTTATAWKHKKRRRFALKPPGTT
jgi:hypothetical protein